MKTPIISRSGAFKAAFWLSLAFLVLINWRSSSSSTNASQREGPDAEVAVLTGAARTYFGFSELASRYQVLESLSDWSQKRIEDLVHENVYLGPSEELYVWNRKRIVTLNAMRAIIAGHSGLSSEFEVLLEWIDRADKTKRQTVLISLIKQAYSKESADTPYSPSMTEAFSELERSFGWLVSVLESDLLGESANVSSEEISKGAMNAAIRNVFAMGLAVTLGLIGFFLLINFFVKLAGREFELRASASVISGKVLIETFTLYLLALMISQGVTTYFFLDRTITESLVFQMTFSVLILPILLWGIHAGVTFYNIRDTLGLKVDSLRTAIREFLIGVLSYIACWPLVILFGIAYEIVLRALNVNIESGEHPVVPLLLGLESYWTLSLLLTFAALIAPAIEELFFRGILYPYLKTKFHLIIAMLLCGGLFAAIHPQGAIGVLPLTLLGAGFCFLREWRGNIFAAIGAHAAVNTTTLCMLILLR
ncbi:MAG: CPBP family intramembrane metalloprotease [Bdellovibrionales bacterium]|nr:CPBP family intramembrane metalloprotease [Bdellovibrionales bacterium]